MMIQLPNQKRFWQVLKILWLIACFLVLVLTLIYRGPEYRDAVEAEVLVMMGLSFPSGWLFFVLLKALQMLGILDMRQATELQSIVIVWVSMFVLGCLQWFVLVPTITGLFRRRFAR